MSFVSLVAKELSFVNEISLRASSRQLVCLLLLLSATNQLIAQELNVFSNGTIADAEKINENFQLLDQKIKAFEGCSASQDGSSVKIVCSDGSVGVLAGAGTVLIYPEGKIGEVPVQEYDNGEIVVVDGGDVVLGVAGSNGDSRFTIKLDNGAYLALLNTTEDSVIYSAPANPKAYFLVEDCGGLPFGQVFNKLWAIEDSFLTLSENPREKLLTKSYKQSNWISSSGNFEELSLNCKNGEKVVDNAVPLVDYQLAAEIREAAFPLQLKQLP